MNEGYSVSKEEKSYNPIEFWDRILYDFDRLSLNLKIKEYLDLMY